MNQAKSSRTERLLAFALLMLNSNRPLSRSEIRDAVRDYPSGGNQEAFERMFERDKDELRSMGLPIQSLEIDGPEGTGYSLALGDAFLPAVNASESEIFALALASRMWREASWSHAATTALRKLELVGGFATDTDFSFNVSVRVDSGALTALLNAAEDRREVSFKYRPADDSAAQKRRLQPWGVVAARGQWYAVGHDLDRAATRAFRMSRIVGDISINKKAAPFEPAPDIDLRNLVLSQYSSPKTFDAVVRLAPDKAPRLRQLATEVVGDSAAFTEIDPDVICTEVLKAGSDATVESPAEIVDLVRQGLENLVAIESRTVNDVEREALAAAAKRLSRNPIESSSDQLGRLLALVPWLRAHPGVTYEAAATHFGVGVDRLQKDLELAVCTEFGSNLLTLDIDAWGKTIQVRDPQGISTPLRFTEAEAFSLLIGLNLLVQLPGPHDVTAVASVGEKLRAAVGETANLTGKLSFDSTASVGQISAANQRESLETALTAGRAVELTYLSTSRDQLSTRVVDPMGLLTTEGATYLQAWCREAEAVRLFRLDRIQTLLVLDEPASVPESAGPLLDSIDPDGELAVLELAPSISWWADQVPNEATVQTNDGTLLVQLRISSDQWAVRTVLGFGGRLKVLEPERLAQAVRDEAEAAIATYPERP